jgi:hypothetical protein
MATCKIKFALAAAGAPEPRNFEIMGHLPFISCVIRL